MTTHPTLATGLAHEREREVRSGAARARLAALASCCRPSQLRRLAARLWFRAPGAATGCA